MVGSSLVKENLSSGMEEVGGYDPHKVEGKIKKYWKEEEAYEIVKEEHEDDPSYYFLDGPPYTSGRVHLGTTWNKLLKDAMVRYLRMNGYDVQDRPGYDMHGLPIEVKVEEKLGIENKNEIEELGVGNFIEECEKFAEENLKSMNKDFKNLGIWMDWENPYKTLNDTYIESVWWGFNKAYKKDLVENGEEVVNQCPRCETSLADAEVEYDEIESPSIYVKIPLVEGEGFLVIWTTTPWTLPSNLYVAVDEGEEYKKIEAIKNSDKEILIIASDCIEEVLKKGRYDDYNILETIDGQSLVGRRYKHPLVDEVPKQKEFGEKSHRIYSTDFVELERTGLVHCAPGHGFEDFEASKDIGLPIFSPVDGNGVYTEEAGKYKGKKIPDVDEEIIEDLEKKDLLLSSERHKHRYGHCWRCDTPIIYIAKEQWFLRVTNVKERLLEELDNTTWFPSWAKESRFRDWVESARDWNISRQRYWGIPIPIWICENGHKTCIESKEELKKRSIDNIKQNLHRPYVDNIKIECSSCGSTAKRIKDVFDVWLDSAAASWASLNYPAEKKKFKELFPPDLIIEAHDQTRGWFWSQLGLGVAALDKVPYQNVVMHGHVLDEDGRKMSKSIGNVIEPGEVIEEYGIDPLRIFLLSRTPHGDDVKFSEDGVRQKLRELNVLWNVYRFPLPYMVLDSFKPEETSIYDVELTDIDKWVLSRLQSVKKDIKEYMENFEINRAQESLISYLVEDVSRFYIQSVRPRMWEEEESEDKKASYATLYRVLEESSKLLAPFAPHTAESIYQNLKDDITVHATNFPKYEKKLQDKTLEKNIDILRDIEEATRNARQKAGRNTRWPVKRIIVETNKSEVKEGLESLKELLLDRVNSYSLDIVEEFDELIEVGEPNMDLIGPEFKEEAGKIASFIEGKTKSELNKISNKDGSERIIEINGENKHIHKDMIEFRQETPENIEKAESEKGDVYIDISLNRELKSEGYTREIVRRIQEMRKELELDMEEQINISLKIDNENIEKMVEEKINYIETETRSNIIENIQEPDLTEKWEIEKTNVTIDIKTI